MKPATCGCPASTSSRFTPRANYAQPSGAIGEGGTTLDFRRRKVRFVLRSPAATRFLLAALASGAQWVSTDYPVPNPAFGTGYQVMIPGGMPARCNPISAPADDPTIT